jgi:hypothetical protein
MIVPCSSEAKRLKGDGEAVGLEVDEVALWKRSQLDVDGDGRDGVDGLPQHRQSGSKQRRWNRRPAGWGWRLFINC